MKSIAVILAITLGVGLTLVADIILKKSGLYNVKLLLLGFLLYGVIAIPVALAFRFVQFGALFIVWEAVVVIVGIIVASFYYKEPFGLWRFMALMLAVGALLLSYK